MFALAGVFLILMQQVDGDWEDSKKVEVEKSRWASMVGCKRNWHIDVKPGKGCANQ